MRSVNICRCVLLLSLLQACVSIGNHSVIMETTIPTTSIANDTSTANITMVGTAATPPPPPIVIHIAGFAKAGTSQLYSVLSNHPHVVSLPKEICGNNIQEYIKLIEIFVDVSIFVSYNLRRSLLEIKRFILNKCRSLKLASDACEIIEKIKWPKKPFSHLLTACITPERTVEFLRYANLTVTSKVMLSSRDPADYSWAVWNFWRNPMDSNSNMKPGEWTTPGNYRSPILFDEIVKSKYAFVGLEVIKPKAFCHYLDIMEQMRTVAGKENVWFLQSENLESSSAYFQMANFTVLGMRHFIDVEPWKKHTNDGFSTKTRGSDAVSPQLHTHGVYQVSGFQPMLSSTRERIYSLNWGYCCILKRDYGLEYKACMNSSENQAKTCLPRSLCDSSTVPAPPPGIAKKKTRPQRVKPTKPNAHPKTTMGTGLKQQQHVNGRARSNWKGKPPD